MANDDPIDAGKSSFTTTRWSLVLAAGSPDSPQAQAALEELCQTYWYPLYAFARRRTGSRERAEDAVQDFFAFVFEKSTLAKAAPEKGPFRGFLQTCLLNFLRNEWREEKTGKRGGGRVILPLDFETADSRYSLEPAAGDLTPEQLFDRAWAVAVLERGLARLREDFNRAGKAEMFDPLKVHLAGRAADELAMKETARRLGKSPDAIAQAAHRMREKLRKLILADVAETLADPGQAEDEVWQLFKALER